MGLYRRVGKRTLDFAGALCAMPLLVVIGSAAAIAVRLNDGEPAIYRSQRRGRGGREFTMYKFRSMTINAPDIRNNDRSTLNSEDDPRVTRVGRFLRKSSIDELPQIVNVLKGDMSFVGPRPNMTSQKWEELTDIERKRVQVRPGITGLSQAYHRNSASTGQKYELDCDYVDRLSLALDAEVMIKTFFSVVGAKNINATLSAGECDSE